MLAENQWQTAEQPAPLSTRSILARDGWAVLAATIATAAIELSAFFWARVLVGDLYATLGALAGGAVWVALASPVLAAGGKTWVSIMLRGGIIADASAVLLIVLWLVSPYVDLAAAAKIYCIYAASALLAVAAVSCARTTAGRYIAAVIAASAIMLAISTPFWVGGMLKAAGQDVRTALAAAAVRVNPFYSITAAVFDHAKFAWNEAKVLYDRVQEIQVYASASPRWYSAAAIHATLAALLAATNLVRGNSRNVRRS
jgi:hypothetical protein